MDNWVLWVGLLLLGMLTLFATLNLALRAPSRVRIAEQFEKSGRGGAFEAFVALRPQYMLATAVLRSIATLAVLFIALYEAGSTDSPLAPSDTVIACVVALALVLAFGVAIPNAWAKYSGEVLTG